MTRKTGTKKFNRTLMTKTQSKIRKAIQKSNPNINIQAMGAGEPDFDVAINDSFVEESQPDGQTCQRLFIEVELKYGFKGDTFKYRTLHIPGRKFKYLKWLRQAPLVYLVFNQECTHCFVITHEQICKHGYFVTKDTKYTDHEVFFEIPTRHLDIVPITELTDYVTQRVD